MKGEIVYLYAFDVANEIVTDTISDRPSDQPLPFERETHRTFPKDVPLYKPLAIKPPPLGASLGGRPVGLLVRVYEVGVVSIVMRVPFEVESLEELRHFHKPVLEDGLTLDAAARRLCAEVGWKLKDVLVESSAASEPEA